MATSIIPIMASNSANGFVLASTSVNEPAWKALDGNIATYYRSSVSPALPESLNITLPQYYVVTGYTISLGYAYLDYTNMATWDFQGMINGMWTTLHSGSHSRVAETLDFTFPEARVSAVRILCKTLFGGNSWGMEELKVYGYTSPIMAGDPLTAPESGWRRYDDSESRITYTGYTVSSYASNYGGSYHLSNVLSSSAKFRFYGTKLRVMAPVDPTFSDVGTIKVDGVSYSFSVKGAATRYQVIIFEKTGLSLGFHDVELIGNNTSYITFDSFDIDNTGFILTPVGKSLLTPDEGWKRYDENESALNYVGSWNGRTSVGGTYGGFWKTTTYQVAGANGSYLEFKFYGTMARLIGGIWWSASNSIDVYVDGVLIQNISQFNTAGMGNGDVPCILNFEKLNLPLGVHTIRLVNRTINYLIIDAIDIDKNGVLLEYAIKSSITAKGTDYKRLRMVEIARDSNISNAIIPVGTTNWAEGAVNFSTDNYYAIRVKNCFNVVIGYTQDGAGNNAGIFEAYVDNVLYGTFSFTGLEGLSSYMLIYEIVLPDLNTHTVKIYCKQKTGAMSANLSFLDVPIMAETLHPKLNQLADLSNALIGDSIPCRYTAASGLFGYFAELGRSKALEIPVTGTPTPEGTFNFIKVAKGKFIADRVIQTSISWDVLNTGKAIEGRPYPFYNSDIEIHEKNDMGSNITSDIITLKTNASAHQGSHVHLYNLKADGTGVVTLEFDGYLDGFYSTAVNLFIGLSNKIEFHDATYFIPVTTSGAGWNTGPLCSGCNGAEPSLNVWHNFKYIIDMVNKTVTCYVDGVVFTVSTYMNPAMFTNDMHIIIGTSPYGYAANFKYKNIKYTDKNSNVITIANTKDAPTKLLIRSLSGGSSYSDYTTKRIVLSLMHGEGIDGSGTFVDNAPKPLVWTKNGSAMIKTDNKKFGNSSMYFNGSTDWIDTPASIDLNLGSDDATIDFWIKRSRLGIAECICGQSSNAGGYTTWSVLFQTNADNTVSFFVVVGSTSYQAKSSIVIADLNWHHVCGTRVGANIYIYIDGVQCGTAIVGLGVAINSSTYKFAIGRFGEYNTVYFNGYVDEFRYIKGMAEYKSNFAPPIQPYTETKNTLEGNFSVVTDKGLGAYPDINEWDKYICKSNLEDKIVSGDDNTWYWSPLYTWVKDTWAMPSLNTKRNMRGKISSVFSNSSNLSSSVYTDSGFRPVLEYIDDSINANKKPTTLFY